MDSVSGILGAAPTGKTVTFFYVTSNGAVNVRKSTDYVAKSIAMAGWEYVSFDNTEEDVRSPLYGARYHSSLPLLLTGSCPNRARKSASGILLIASISVRSMPVSVDDELDADPELRVELPCVATPQATLTQIGK